MTTGIVNARTWQLLDLLADGEFHSGEALATRLGVSRATVFNALAEVADFGVMLHRIRGRGYRLARPWQRLDRDEILRWLGGQAGEFEIEIMPQANLVLVRDALCLFCTHRPQVYNDWRVLCSCSGIPLAGHG